MEGDQQEPKTSSDLFIDYVAILAAIPEVARFVGQSVIGDYVPAVPAWRAWSSPIC